MPAPYDGEILDYCTPIPFDFGHTFAVVVSGAAWNPCGHMLLNVGGRGGHSLHVAEVHGYPRYMGEAGYERYLREHRKREISRTRVLLKRPLDAQLKLERLLAEKWAWFVLPHNCAVFVETVVAAGGSDAGLWTNCPAGEHFR